MPLFPFQEMQSKMTIIKPLSMHLLAQAMLLLTLTMSITKTIGAIRQAIKSPFLIGAQASLRVVAFTIMFLCMVRAIIKLSIQKFAVQIIHASYNNLLMWIFYLCPTIAPDNGWTIMGSMRAQFASKPNPNAALLKRLFSSVPRGKLI